MTFAYNYLQGNFTPREVQRPLPTIIFRGIPPKGGRLTTQPIIIFRGVSPQGGLDDLAYVICKKAPQAQLVSLTATTSLAHTSTRCLRAHTHTCSLSDNKTRTSTRESKSHRNLSNQNKISNDNKTPDAIHREIINTECHARITGYMKCKSFSLFYGESCKSKSCTHIVEYRKTVCSKVYRFL